MTATTVTLDGRRAGLVRLIGLAGVLAGIAFIVAAIAVWVTVSTQLRAENITIPDDAIAFQGQIVDDPLEAYVQADIINKHALDMSDGKTYAELDRDDPTRAVVMDASFLRASLFTSVVSFGIAVLVAGLGVLFVLFGGALRWLVPSAKARRNATSAVETAPAAEL